MRGHWSTLAFIAVPPSVCTNPMWSRHRITAHIYIIRRRMLLVFYRHNRVGGSHMYDSLSFIHLWPYSVLYFISSIHSKGNKGNHSRLHHFTIQSSHSTSIFVAEEPFRITVCRHKHTLLSVDSACFLMHHTLHIHDCASFQFKQSMKQPIIIPIRPTHCTFKGPYSRMHGYTYTKQYISRHLHIKGRILDVTINLHFIHLIRLHRQNNMSHQQNICLTKSRRINMWAHNIGFLNSQLLQTQWPRCCRGSLPWHR